MRNALSVSALCFLLGVPGDPARPPSLLALPAACGSQETSWAEESACSPDSDYGLDSDSRPDSDYTPDSAVASRGEDYEFDQTLGTGQDIDPFGATPHEIVAEMIALAGVGKDDVVYDLGSGDGRIPIAAATQAGARGVGIELRPELVQKSREAAKDAGVAARVQFQKKDFFEVELSDATVVMLYLFPRTALKLRPKLLDELKPGTRIVAYNYGIEGWPRDKEQPVKPPNYGTLYYWVVPANVSGSWHGSISLGPGDDRRFTLQLDQTYQQVSGKVSFGEQESPLHDAHLKADTLTLSWMLPGEARLVLSGQAKGDRIQGVVRLAGEEGASSEGIWQAARESATATSIDPGVQSATEPSSPR